jgi:Zn-dependent peptidase ImmA (M78 family)
MCFNNTTVETNTKKDKKIGVLSSEKIVTKRKTEKIAMRVIQWSAKQFGYSSYIKGGPPLLEVQYQCDEDERTYGEFDVEERMIYIYTRRNTSIRCLVNTIIHEYKHYLQNPTWTTRYLKKYGSSIKNPYEQEAESHASKYTTPCMKSLKLLNRER